MFKLFDGKVTLNVETDSPMDEVFLMDSGLQRVAKGLGGLKAANLEPGVYKLKFKSGDAVQEQSVVLNQAEVNIKGEAMRLATAIPIVGTPPPGVPTPAPTATAQGRPGRRRRSLRGASHGATPAPGAPSAITPTTQTQWTGTGGGLYFFLQATDAASAQRILSAAQVIDEHGNTLSATTDGPVYSQGIDCAPGNYTLRVDAGEAGIVDMCLPVSAGWRVSVFMPVREVGRTAPVQVPDVLNAGILYSRLHEQLNPADPNLRWTEQARLALLAGRSVAPKEQFERLLTQDWHQPMYLLLGAHLLLREREVDQSLLTRLTMHLKSLLPNHQDVELLELYGQKDADQAPPRLTLRWPPMLTHTFRLLEHPFMRDRVVIAPGSIAESAMLSPWGGSTWFLWRSRGARSPRTNAV
jgi:hypothetical protein